MTNPSKAKGTAAESAVLAALRDMEHPEALRVVLHGSSDWGDVHYTARSGALVAVEVKGGTAAEKASSGTIERWLDEAAAEARNSGRPLAMVVTKRAGVGAPRAALWWAHARFVATNLGAVPTLHGGVVLSCTFGGMVEAFDAIGGVA